MNNIDKISIKIIEEEKEIGESRLVFEIYGNNIDYILMNTLRRTIFSDIPIYSFEEFIFDKNTSIFHNNYLKVRLSNFPIWGIDNNIDYIENNSNDNINNKDNNDNNEYDSENDDIDDNLNKGNKTILTKNSNLKEFSMYLNYINKTNDIITVSTDDAKFYYDQKLINSPYKIPIPIVKLSPKQEILFTSIGKIGIEASNVTHSAVSVVAYTQISDTKFNFLLESRGQISEKRIIVVAIINIKRRLNNLLNYLNNYKISDKLEDFLIIENENDTLGNFITRGLQLHKNIKFAGYNLPHPLVKTIHIHYEMNSNFNIKDIFKDVVNYYIKILDIINKEFI